MPSLTATARPCYYLPELHRLRELYGGFEEGFATPDPRAAAGPVGGG